MKKRDYITVLSVLAAFAVVFLHTNCCFGEFSYGRYWKIANIVQWILYCAVPIFLMITGATLIDYHEKYLTKEYITKRVNKAVIPFVFWNFVALFFCIIVHKISLKSISFKLIFDGFFSVDNFNYFFWFFIFLFGIYLCIPVLSFIDKKYKNKVLLYLAIVGCAINCLIPFIFDAFKLDLRFQIPFICSGYLIYPIVGYLIDRNKLSLKLRIIIYSIGISCLLLQIIGTFILSYKAGYLVKTFDGYWNIPCMFYSISVYVFFKHLCERINNKKIQGIFDKLSKYTFPIYLLHFFVLEIGYKVLNIDIRSIYFRAGAPLIIIPSCILFTWLIRKIPFVKKILP